MQYPPETLWDSYPEGWKAGDMKVYLDEIHATMGATVSCSKRALRISDFFVTCTCTCTFNVYPILLLLALTLYCSTFYSNRAIQVLMESTTTMREDLTKSRPLWKLSAL